MYDFQPNLYTIIKTTNSSDCPFRILYTCELNGVYCDGSGKLHECLKGRVIVFK